MSPYRSTLDRLGRSLPAPASTQNLHRNTSPLAVAILCFGGDLWKN
jgi:hypothetical protein